MILMTLLHTLFGRINQYYPQFIRLIHGISQIRQRLYFS